MLSSILAIGQFVIKEVSDWSKRRDALKTATLDADIAEIRARAEIAAYKVKSDIEWDLTWAGQAQTSWKDEYLLLLWSVPLFAMIPALFIPGLREGVMETLAFAKDIHPYAIEMYLGGWGVIFSATFGLKAASQVMIPGKVKSVVDAFKGIPDDIPAEAVDAAQDAIREGKGLF